MWFCSELLLQAPKIARVDVNFLLMNWRFMVLFWEIEISISPRIAIFKLYCIHFSFVILFLQKFILQAPNWRNSKATACAPLRNQESQSSFNISLYFTFRIPAVAYGDIFMFVQGGFSSIPSYDTLPGSFNSSDK